MGQVMEDITKEGKSWREIDKEKLWQDESY
jgi:hypothetical protein